MINLQVLKKANYLHLEEPDIDTIVTPDFIKNLRVNLLDMSQEVFAITLGVSKKTVEKWESLKSKYQISSSMKRYLYLLNQHPEYINELLKFEYSKSLEEKKIVASNTVYKQYKFFDGKYSIAMNGNDNVLRSLNGGD